MNCLISKKKVFDQTLRFCVLLCYALLMSFHGLNMLLPTVYVRNQGILCHLELCRCTAVDNISILAKILVTKDQNTGCCT